MLSFFGLVPAALCGVDIAALCASADAIDLEEAVALGVVMAEAAKAGRDKVTIVVPERFRAFGLWIEQLIAESTGKRGVGCVPVPTGEAEAGDDRHIVHLDIDDAAALGGEFYRWQVATAIAGHVLGIDPFDEPNVAESKANTAKVLDHLPLPDVPAAESGEIGPWLAEQVRDNDYVSLQAYVPYGHDDWLEGLRRSIRDALGGVAVTAGYGPRFLHSTGQLHKGGANNVVAVQLVSREATAKVSIPGYDYDFGTLIAAQSIGDHQSLVDHGRRVLRVAVDDLGD